MNNFTTARLAANAVFDWREYSTLAVFLLTSFAIGIYYGIFRSNATPERNLVGEKMGFLPLTGSIIAAATSGVTFLGHSTESYTHGITYCVYLFISQILSGLISVFICLPLVYNLKLNNVYEYFEKRFDDRVRKLSIIVFVLMQITYAAISSYPPAVVISQFSGFSPNMITIEILAFCTLCTLLGGFKGVVVMDTLQAIVMIFTAVVILPFGSSRAGGFHNVWSIARDSGRLLDFTFNPDPTIRQSFWSVVIGSSLSLTVHVSLSQSMHQRYACLKSFRQAKWACVALVISLSGFAITMAILGLQAYATYNGCEPKSANLVRTYTNAIVYWINDVGLRVNGLRGIFMAGIISASMSTVSTIINTVAGVLFLEFVKNRQRTEGKLVTRGLIVGVGVTSCIVFLAIKDSGSINELLHGFTKAGEGLLAGLFALGMLTISANATGTFWGGLISLAMISFLTIGSRIYISQGLIPSYPTKMMRTDLCPNNSMIIQKTWSQVNFKAHYVPLVFKISSFYYSSIAFILTLAAGLAISYMPASDEDETNVRPELIYKPLRKYLKRNRRLSRSEKGEEDIALNEKTAI